tara:strand:- start:23 stop:499 length:477 start_codon:yes stop_codon:yes gene_type:complete
MKNYKKGLKKFLMERNMSDYADKAVLSLYHFSPVNKDTLVLDPEHFLSSRSTFSKREYEKSQVPRTFFYLDLDHAESIVKPGRTLYKTTVPSSHVYDLSKDPENIVKNSVQPGAFFVDYNKVFNAIKENYNGAFYKLPNFDVVVWFQPIEVHKHEEEL